MYAIFLGDCINRMCFWNEQQKVGDSSTTLVLKNLLPYGQGRYEHDSAIPTTNPPRYNCAKLCFQEKQILALRRSNSAPPFKRKKLKLQITMP